MSYSISYDQFASLLNSNDENVVKAALQEIFELLVAGKRMVRSKKVAFTQIVEIHVNSKSQKVRKWAYHCACFYQNESVCQSIKRQLDNEHNTENIIWALTALSVVYDDAFKLKKCVGRRHDEFVEQISENYLNDALILFGGTVRIDPGAILAKNNSADLAALAKIYAYRGLVYDKYPDVTQSIIRELEQNEDPYVREYAYWAQALGLAKGDYFNSLDDSDAGVRKWQIALQIQNGDEDFVVSALKVPAMYPEKISLDVKIGIIRGLNSIEYNKKYVPFIFSWFGREIEYTIVFQLIDYMIANCFANRDDGTFYDAIKDSLSDDLLVFHIIGKIESNPQCDLSVSQHGERYVLDFKTKGERIVQNINITGSGNTVAVADRNSQAIALSPPGENRELERLLQEVRKQAEDGLSEEDKEKVNEGVSAIAAEAKADNPKKTVIKAILESLRVIQGTVQFASAVAALIKFFE